MSNNDFDDIIRDFAKERQDTGAAGDDAAMGDPIPVTSLLVVPVRDGDVLASVLKSGGAVGSVLATEQGCLVSLEEGTQITPREAAEELSGMLAGADLLLLTRQGGPQDEGQMSCERIRDGEVVERPVVAMIIDVLPEPARRALLMGERLSQQRGSVDIGSSPDPPPGGGTPLQASAADPARRMASMFDNILVFIVLLGGVLLVVQGLGLFTTGGISWMQLIFGVLACIWCGWRLSPAGRRKARSVVR